jgi:DNA-binding transcriptional ArsR family regulator
MGRERAAMAFRVRLGAADAGRVRFATSPVWETVNAARTLVDPRSAAYHSRWLERARPRAAELPLEPLFAVHPPRGYVPDFLSPPPQSTSPHIASELALVRETPREQVERELTRCATNQSDPARRAIITELAADPERARDELADLLQLAWDELVAPGWSRIERLLRRDIDQRAQLLAREGLAAVIEDLHPRVTWQDGAISVDIPEDIERDLGGKGLILMPSAFIWPVVTGIVDPPWQPSIIYPARGVGDLWAAPPAPPAPLGRLLGASRAQLLSALDQPASTTALAKAYDMSLGNVSGHLAVLRDAGLVTTTRVGHEVRYGRTELGEALVSGAVA